jgi:hypothetical protein
LQGLLADDFIQLRPRPPYGPSLEPSNEANALAQSISGFPDLARKLDFIAAKLGSKGVGELERIATAVYVNEKYGTDISFEQRAAMLVSLKPHVASDAARSAFIDADKIQKELLQAA